MFNNSKKTYCKIATHMRLKYQQQCTIRASNNVHEFPIKFLYSEGLTTSNC